MNPLSIIRYYLNNKKRFISIVIVIALSVLLLYTIQMLLKSTDHAAYVVSVEPKKFFSSVGINETVLDKDIVNDLKKQNFAEKVLPAAVVKTNFTISFSPPQGAPIFMLKENDIHQLMGRMNLKLVKGNLPKPGRHEVIIHRNISNNKKLKIGDKVGSKLDKDEWLEGEYEVVGIFEGSSVLGFSLLDDYMNDKHIRYEYIDAVIIPKKNKLEALNNYLESLPSHDGKLWISTYDSTKRSLENVMESVYMLLTTVNIMVIAIVSICIGFLCYIYFYQRRNEFGLLNAIGYTRQQIINRAFAEVCGMNIIGFILGLILSMIVGNLLNIFLFAPKGQPLQLWDFDYITKTFCIPLFSILFGIIPVWRMLKRLNPIAIIEGVV
ncbi:MAG: ABC transporter permease [Bacillota bacterium]|nr:ABC transporter permease [Bacillota bacterium]